MITGRQIQAARALLGWSQQELADEAKISRNALQRMENGRVAPLATTLEAVWRTLERAGIEFLSDSTSEGVRLRFPDSTNDSRNRSAASKKT